MLSLDFQFIFKPVISVILVQLLELVVWLGSLTVTCRTCNPEVAQVAGLRHCQVANLPYASCSHTCASVTKQYKLVSASLPGRLRQ